MSASISTGRSVNCRYTPDNRVEIYNSRIVSTRLLGDVIGSLANPPRVWLNASTATIYRHALDRPMDEKTGELGGNEPGAPDTWNFSIRVARDWETAFFKADTPQHPQSGDALSDHLQPGRREMHLPCCQTWCAWGLAESKATGASGFPGFTKTISRAPSSS